MKTDSSADPLTGDTARNPEEGGLLARRVISAYVTVAPVETIGVIESLKVYVPPAVIAPAETLRG